MTDTLTMQPETLAEGELNTDEQDSLQIGEELVEQQDSLILGKYKNAEELEKAHVELQKKLGEKGSETESEPEAEAEDTSEGDAPDAVDILDRIWEEGTNNNKVPQELLNELSGMKATDVAKLALSYRQKVAENQPPPMTEEIATKLKGLAGGQEGYTNMISWAKDNLAEQDIGLFDAVIQRGDPLACHFAIKSLAYQYQDASGKEGQMLTGKAPSTTGAKFKSQAEVVRAMSDPRYDEDPAYRQEITQKLGRSNIDF